MQNGWLQEVQAGVHQKIILGFLLDCFQHTAIINFAYAIRDGVLLHGTHQGQLVGTLFVEFINRTIVRMYDDVAVRNKEGDIQPAFQVFQRPGSAQRLVLLEVVNAVAKVVVVEIGLDHPAFIVQGNEEIVHTELPELIHDDLDHRVIAEWNERLGQDFRERVQARALAPGHDDHRVIQRPLFFALLYSVKFFFRYDIKQLSVLQHGHLLYNGIIKNSLDLSIIIIDLHTMEISINNLTYILIELNSIMHRSPEVTICNNPDYHVFIINTDTKAEAAFVHLLNCFTN